MILFPLLLIWLPLPLKRAHTPSRLISLIHSPILDLTLNFMSVYLFHPHEWNITQVFVKGEHLLTSFRDPTTWWVHTTFHTCFMQHSLAFQFHSWLSIMTLLNYLQNDKYLIFERTWTCWPILSDDI